MEGGKKEREEREEERQRGKVNAQQHSGSWVAIIYLPGVFPLHQGFQHQQKKYSSAEGTKVTQSHLIVCLQNGVNFSFCLA